MKYAKIALAVLMVSCSSLPSGTGSQSATTPPNTPLSSEKAASLPLPTSSFLPQVPLIDSAQAQIQSSGRGDELSLKVIIQKPGMRTQRLELDKITHLRAWVSGSDINTPIFNLNQYVAVSSNGENTSLRIQTVPRGKNRVVSVQGYDNTPNHAEIPGALLKAVYSSPENSTEIVLTFTWRSTATAAILEALLKRDPAITGNMTPTQVSAFLDNLNLTQLNSLLDQVIYGNHPVGGNTFALHPSRLNAEALAKALVDANGQVPTLNPGDPTPGAWIKPMANLNVVVRTPNNVAFNSSIQVQITDPASAPVSITAGQDTGNLPQIIPGTWQAIAKLDGLNGGVSARTQLTVDANGNVNLTEGSSNNPLILPPVMTALSTTQGASGSQMTITGDGFNPAGGNTVKFGNVVANVELATATSLVVKVPPGISGTVPIQVTNNGKQSNTANFTVDTRIVSLSSPGGKVGDSLSLQVSGFDATQNPTVVFSNGVQATINTQQTTAGTLVVTVPAGAATGPITVTPQGGNALQSPTYTIGTPVISSITPDSASVGATVTLTGANFTGANQVTLNGQAVNNLTVVNDTTLTFAIPPGASTGTVQVTTPLGSGTSTTALSIPQQIVSLSSPGGKPNDSVTITVSGFNPTTSNPTVTFSGGVTGSVTATTANTVTVTVPAGATTGPITVTPQAGNALQSATYTIGTPVISSFTATAAVGQQVTLNGANFTGATQVQFNGLSATSYTVNNDGTLTVTVPAGATDGPIRVTTPSGTGTSASNFQVLRPPTITNVANDPLQPTGPIVLTGSGYVSGSVVMLGTTVLNPNTYTINSPTQITINTPPLGNTLDSVTVFNPAGSAISSLIYKDVINFIGNAAQVARTDVNFTIENAHGINVDHDSNIYIASLSHKIYKFNQAGQNQWVSGDNAAGFRKDELTVPADKLKETTLANARFSGPEDLANDSQGNIYVADTSNHAIRKITPDGKVQVLARLPGPEGIEISKNNELFVTCTDPPNASSNITSVFVAKIADLNTLPSLAQTQLYDVDKSMTPNVQVIAGGPPAGPATATPVSPIANARFLHLEGLGIDGDGNVYVADVNNYQIRKINFQTNQVSVFATLSYSFSPPNSDTRPWVEMHEIRVDPYGNVFVPAPCCNFGFNSAAKIYRITPTGAITRIAGTGSVGLAEGKPLTAATFGSPRGIDFAPDGTLYIADTSWGIRRIDRYQPLPVNP